MSPELYSATKPAVPWRGPAMAFLLLAATSTLAGLMVHRRGELRLLPVKLEQGWNATYALPAGSTSLGQASYESWRMAQFSVPVGLDGNLIILFWERPVESEVPRETLADAVFQMTAVLSGRLLVEPVPTGGGEDARIGSFPALEVRSREAELVSRAVVYETVAHAVSMLTSVPADKRAAAYERFDATCRSMRLR